jgi:hypothetical protein
MIFKVSKHCSKRHLRNLVRYLLSRKGKSNERVLRHESLNALPFLPGDSTKEYACQWASDLWRFTELERCGKEPPENHFVHCVMSFFPGNDQHIADAVTAEQALAIAKEAMAEVAPGERQVLYAVHGDKAHLHVHIVFSVTERGGRIWNPHHDFRLWEAAAARLETKHGLYEVKVGRPAHGPAWKKSPTTKELNQTLRTGQPSDRMVLQQIIDAALAGNPTFPVFWQRLLDAGVTPIPNIASTGRVSGMSFQHETGLPMKGSALGKGYSWGSLAKQVHFAASQHSNLLTAFIQKEPAIDGAVHTQPEPQAEHEHLTAKPSLARFVARLGADKQISWVWRNKPKRIAFVESPKVCVARSAHQAVHEAMAERCLQRGLQRVGVTGSEVFRRRMWFELSLRGITAVGYEPTDEDKYRLEWWINEQASDGGGTYPRAHSEPDGRDGNSAFREAGHDAPREAVNARRVGRNDVSVAAGDDLPSAGKPGATPGDAFSDDQRDPAGKSGDERAAIDDGGPTHVAHRNQTGRRSEQLSSTPYIWRASRLGKAALLRQGLLLPTGDDECQAVIETVEALDRRFTNWSITFGPPGQVPLGQVTRCDELASSWSSFQVVNSLGSNIRLQLSSLDSWLHLTGVTESDLQILKAQGIRPTAQFTIAGATQIFAHVNYGDENRKVMKCLAEQIQAGLEAQVHTYFGNVSFPVGGFDYWLDGDLHACSEVRFDPSTMGAQFTTELKRLKGEIGVSKILGTPSVQISIPDGLEKTVSSNAKHDVSRNTETPRPEI